MKKNAIKKTTPNSDNKKSFKMTWTKAIILTVLILACTTLAIWNSWLNRSPALNVITVQESNLPAEFDGFRIAHISDFHSAENMTDKVVKLLQEAKPDIICITGDLIDSRDKDAEVALNLVEKAMEIAQCYFVTGNHEKLVSAELFNSLLEEMANRGVILLDEEVLQREDSEIALFGDFHGDAKDEEFIPGYEGYKILLSHYPENTDYYVAAKYDLVLTGHAHGGMFRLPFIGGIYAPGQGLFPKYDAGLYTKGATDLVVNRGIGNSTIPLRFNNQPEVVLVELRCK